MASYEITVIAPPEIERLRRVYGDLKSLSACPVPSVQAAARAALAHIAQALNGQGLEYDLYSTELEG